MKNSTLITFAGLALALQACSRVGESSLEPLIGRWATAHHLYAQRSFEITGQHDLWIGLGEGKVERCRILAVERENGDPSPSPVLRHYSLEYEDSSGLRDTLTFEYSAQTKTVRLRNRPNVVWSRQLPR